MMSDVCWGERGGGEEEQGGADTELKTKTPHINVVEKVVLFGALLRLKNTASWCFLRVKNNNGLERAF